MTAAWGDRGAKGAVEHVCGARVTSVREKAHAVWVTWCTQLTRHGPKSTRLARCTGTV